MCCNGNLFWKGREKETDKERFLTHWFTPQMSTQPGLGQAEVRSQESNPDLQSGWQGPTNFSHYLLSPRVRISGNLGSGAEAGLEPLYSNVDAAVPKCCLNC